MEKTWFSIDGGLEPIDYSGPSYFRFPVAVADHVIAHYSAEGDWILDPFCGFGTTLLAAQRLGRHSIGFEHDSERANFAASRISPPRRVISSDARQIADYSLPQFALLFTSPPYTTFRATDPAGAAAYFDDLREIFTSCKAVMQPGARVIVEVSNVREGPHVRTVAWDAGRVLADIFHFDGEVIRCNTGTEHAGPGYNHSYLLQFTV